MSSDADARQGVAAEVVVGQGRPAPHAPGPAWRRWTSQLLVVVVVLGLLSLKTVNYAAPESIRLATLSREARGAVEHVRAWVRNASWLHSCGRGTTKRTVPGGYVCAAPTGPGSVQEKIFTSYPIDGGSRTAIYPAMMKPSPRSRQDADAWLSWRVPVPRYDDYQAGPGTDWAALDPDHSAYWRFYYYSARPLVPLVNAYVATGRRAYLDRLWAVQDRFLQAPDTSRLVWGDEHAVAMRAMVLGYEWWTLREYHALTVQQSDRLLAEITRTAEFLLDRNHYQPQMNHGTNQAAALLLVAESFPDLPNATAWRQTALTRLTQGIQQLVDDDGALIENSPYYHMYELDKYWQIREFARLRKIPLDPVVESKIRSMIHYATYLLEPDGSVPLLGASLEETFHDWGVYAEMGELDPQLRYVLSQGRAGRQPEQTSIHFPKAGLTVLRSGWGTGQEFAQASYLTFNVGAYRTRHSQLDSLGVTFYDNGATLLPPGGLYSYAPGPLTTYFQGTSSHNTVVVDGRDQARGTATAGPLVTRDGVTYQSAYTPVYDGVSDERTVVMVDKDHYLVVDRLSSTTTHTFDQVWHLFPGAKVTTRGLTVTGDSAVPGQRVSISQLDGRNTGIRSVSGQRQPPAGLCSRQYEVVIPCEQVSYRQTATSATFTTLISAGPDDPSFTATYDPASDTVHIRDAARTVTLALGQTTGRNPSVAATVTPAPVPAGTPLTNSDPGPAWRAAPESAGGRVAQVGTEAGRTATALTAADAPTPSGVTAVNDTVRADLSTGNLLVRMKATNLARLGALDLQVTSGGAAAATISLRSLYDRRWEGEWVTLSVVRDDQQAGQSGHWTRAGPLDWAHIDGLRLRLSATAGSGPAPSALVESIRQVPMTRQGSVVFVFDDGYESILPAAQYLHDHGYPGNVAVIGKYTQLPARGYLNVNQLRALQDEWGWNMVNHSQKHQDAVVHYAGRNLGAYEQDILDGATWLQRAGLNSAPNWYVYPNGATNAELADVVGRFYTFARTVNPGSESTPFGSPLRVRTFELHHPKDSSDSPNNTLTTVAQARAAIADAATYHQTLIITAHRIHSLASDRAGYPVDQFRQIVDAVTASGLPVKTLSQLDEMNGVTQDNLISVTPAVAPLITVSVTVTEHEKPHGLFGWFRRLW